MTLLLLGIYFLLLLYFGNHEKTSHTNFELSVMDYFITHFAHIILAACYVFIYMSLLD